MSKNETAHTPIPWDVGMWNCVRLGAIHFGPRNEAGNIYPVGYVPLRDLEEDYSDRESTNAHLIVRAVNAHEALLDACRQFVQAIETKDNLELENAVKSAKDAIAKAEDQ